MARPIAKLLTGFLVVAALLLVAALALTLSQPAPALPPTPNPNGYDDFVRASTMIGQDVGDYVKMTRPELQAAAGKNEEALKLVRVGLSRECRALPLDLCPTNSARFEHLAGIKRLGRALAAAGRLAELENRPGDAAEEYLAVIQLGSAMGQGGLLIELLVGVAIQAIGTTPLDRLVPLLDANQCRQAAATLEACERRREPVDAAVARERVWANRTLGLTGRIARLFNFRSLRQGEQRATAKVQAQAKHVRSLLIQCAARAYELEKGERPKSVADLVPAYLQAIPQDPGTGTNMAY